MSRKKNSGYFHWNDRLDQLLVKSMRTLVDEKKIDPKGKFIAGAYLVLEQMLENDSPGCGVKAEPNIVSRVKTLKAKFLAMQELRGLSGAGWDDEQKMVELEDSTYDEYVASHPHCAKMNRVPFPCYDGLAYVFGKVRATGKGAVGLEELEKGFPPIELPKTPLLGLDSGEMPNVETDPTGQPNNTPEGREAPRPSVNAGNSEGSNRRKRARPSNIGTSSDVTELKPIFEDAASSLRSMVQESDKSRKQRSMMLPELEMIEGLTMDQVYDAAIQLGKDDGMLELFFNITTNQGRKRFIERLLL
ncbi:hypothetical protein LINPERPRIM_LOCUS6174 [Linum perenne]